MKKYGLLLFFLASIQVSAQADWEKFSPEDSIFFSRIYHQFRNGIPAFDPAYYYMLEKKYECPSDSCHASGYQAYWGHSGFAFYYKAGSTQLNYATQNGYGRLWLGKQPYAIEKDNGYSAIIRTAKGKVYDSKDAPNYKLIPGLLDSNSVTLVEAIEGYPNTLIRFVVDTLLLHSKDDPREYLFSCRLLQNLQPLTSTLQKRKNGDTLFISFGLYDVKEIPKPGDTLFAHVDQFGWTDSKRRTKTVLLAAREVLYCPESIDTALYFNIRNHYEIPMISRDFTWDMKRKKRFVHNLIHPNDSIDFARPRGKMYRKYRRYKLVHRAKDLPFNVYCDELLMYMYRNKKNYPAQ